MKPATEHVAAKYKGEEDDLSEDGTESLRKISNRVWTQHTDYKNKVQAEKDVKDAKKAHAEKMKVTAETMINLRPDGKAVHAPTLDYEMTSHQRKALQLLSKSNSSTTKKRE